MKNIEVHIEIPKGSNIKYEFNREKNRIEVDRILRDGFTYPANYGYIKEALDWDGDELDVLVYSTEKFQPGVALNATIIGAMKMIDDSETDTKLIAIHADDYRLANLKSIDDLPKDWLEEVRTFFTTYKNWKKPDITSVSGFEKADWAIAEYKECVELMQQYGSLEKDAFIKKMQKLHPEKYQ